MKAAESNLLVFLRKSPQFVIPIYQRNYSWTETQCRQLWDDLMRAGGNTGISAHFIGSIVYIERGLSAVTSQEPLLVIDGQQRLTTSALLIAALAEHFEMYGIGELLETFSSKKLRNYYLLNPDEDGDRHFKLLLSETDRETLLAILKKTPMPAEASQRITENFELFKKLINAQRDELERICQGLAKLMIVDVSLDRSQDNPQLIFESMNSTGLELSQADLIRNYILMGQEPRLQTELYKTYWRPMEKAFGQAAYIQHFDAFMRHYLTVMTGEIPNLREVYAVFKTFAQGFGGSTRELVADIHAFAGYYCTIALGANLGNGALTQAFHDLRELKVDVAYPFLLDVYHAYAQGRLPADDVLQIVRLVESYVFRRAICAIPTNSMNRTFAGLARTLNKERYLESLQAAFLLMPSYRRFPGDDEFQHDLKLRDLYNFRSRSYWLRRLENHGRKERVLVEDYTIEHILPQNAALSAQWQAELGADWQRVQQDWLHTLGNLTLSGYNSEYSDRPFAVKREQVKDRAGNPVGFAHSPLRLNLGLGKVAVWNEAAIKTRADRLATEACKVWGGPQLSEAVLATYRPVVRTGHTYGVVDHANLAAGPVRDLFDALRQSILALDLCVSEEFRKMYVAYKAETNFVDVIPQARRLLLVLNLRIADIEDPKGMCRDISNLGRWGNGDVDVRLSNLDELPYVLGLVRQAFDRQMEAEDA